MKIQHILKSKKKKRQWVLGITDGVFWVFRRGKVEGYRRGLLNEHKQVGYPFCVVQCHDHYKIWCFKLLLDRTSRLEGVES